MTSIKTFVSDLPHEFLNSFRLRSLGKVEVLLKFRSWLET